MELRLQKKYYLSAMRLLFLAPQPFYQERGTPIAVRLALEVLAERGSKSSFEQEDLRDSLDQSRIDLLVYHEGKDITVPGVKIHRTRIPSFLKHWLKNIGPGISVKKIFCDVFFAIQAFRMVLASRGKQYQLIHAVEEGALIALLISRAFGIPYIYDMDSSIALQTTEKWWFLKPLQPLLDFVEKTLVCSSIAVVPVCDALAAIAKKHGSHLTQILRDVSLLREDDIYNLSLKDSSCLREELGISPHDPLAVYIGNLESYQGIDLLIESLLQIKDETNLAIVIIGGTQKRVEYYNKLALSRGLKGRFFLVGAKPIEDLDTFIMQADILLSPRIKGNNTPMKIYSYLHSGRAILATDLPTHTQVLNRDVAILAAPKALNFGQALLKLAQDPTLRENIGAKGKLLAEENYTFTVFKDRLNNLYDRISATENLSAEPLKIAIGS